MKQVKIIKNNVVEQTALFENDTAMNAWIELLASSFVWGKPAGFYPISSLSAEDMGTEISRKNVDELGNPLLEILIEIPAQYQVVIEDVTAKINQENINRAALEYLASTDWYIIRNQETGVPVPQNILDLRASARLAIVKV